MGIGRGRCLTFQKPNVRQKFHAHKIRWASPARLQKADQPREEILMRFHPLQRRVGVEQIGRLVGRPSADIRLDPLDISGLQGSLGKHLLRIVEPVDRRGGPPLSDDPSDLPRSAPKIVDDIGGLEGGRGQVAPARVATDGLRT